MNVMGRSPGGERGVVDGACTDGRSSPPSGPAAGRAVAFGRRGASAVHRGGELGGGGDVGGAGLGGCGAGGLEAAPRPAERPLAAAGDHGQADLRAIGTPAGAGRAGSASRRWNSTAVSQRRGSAWARSRRLHFEFGRRKPAAPCRQITRTGRARPSTTTSRRPGRARRRRAALPEPRPLGAGAVEAARPGNNQAAGGGRGSLAVDLLPHVPADGDHGVLVERWDARARAADRRARLAEDDEALRSDGGHDQRRRDRTHRDLMTGVESSRGVRVDPECVVPARAAGGDAGQRPSRAAAGPRQIADHVPPLDRTSCPEASSCSSVRLLHCGSVNKYNGAHHYGSSTNAHRSSSLEHHDHGRVRSVHHSGHFVEHRVRQQLWRRCL